jgi:hypothetical protein
MWNHKRRRTLENKNRQGEKDMLQGADIVKFIKFLRLRLYGHVEKNRKPTNAKTNSRIYNGSNKEKRKTM